MDKNELKRKLRQKLKTGIPQMSVLKPASDVDRMSVEQLQFSLDSGSWSAPLPKRLDSERTLVLAFGSPRVWDARGAFDDLASVFPSSIIVGCSGAGEISATTVIDDAISVSVSRFAQTDIEVASAKVSGAEESFDAGTTIAKSLLRDDLRAIFLLSEGLNVNGTDLVRGVNSVVPESVVVTGGLAGDGTDFSRTWVYVDGNLDTNTIAAVGFYGDAIEITHGSQGGWDRFGPIRTVTRSEGNVLHELDGKPALALYKTYLGDLADELPASGLRFPLAIVGGDGGDRNVVRTLLSVDHEAQTLTFAGDIPEGAHVQLMKAHFDRLVDGADEAASMAYTELDDGLAVAVSCVGRRLVLGERTEDELEAVAERLPGSTKLTGFYSYGELSPVADGRCDLHNQTMTLTVFSEKVARRSKTRPEVPRFENISRPRQQGFASKQSTFTLDDGAWTESLPVLDSEQTLVLAFGSPRLWDNPEVFGELQRAYPQSHVVGCSGSGEIAGVQVHDDSLCVTATRFEHTTLDVAWTEVGDATESFDAGQKIAKQLAQEDLRAVFIISEGLQINGTDLVRGVNSVVDEDVVVTGGLAGDGTDFNRTWVYCDGSVRTHVVAAVGFYGDHIRISHGSQGGWDAFGPQRKVTRSEGNVLYELDGKPALALYKTYLGDRADDLPASGLRFPLALIDHESEDRNVVRTLLDIDHEEQTLTFAGDIPQGANVQLMKANFNRLVDGADIAASMAALGEHEDDSLTIAVSCVGRRLVLGERTEDELEAVSARLGSSSTVTGFYSYGELSPVAEGRCDLHNQTMTLTVFSESPTPIERQAPTSTELETRLSVFDLGDASWTDDLPDNDSRRTLVLAFGSPAIWDKRDAFAELEAKYPNAQIVGCSGSGEIARTEVKDESLVVTSTRFRSTDLEVAWTAVDGPEESFSAGETIARQLQKPGLRAVFILSEGLQINGTELVRGVNSVVDEDVVVTGGLAGDGTDFNRTWVYVDGEVRTKAVLAVGFYGDSLVVSHGSQGGWDSFGPERTVTRSEGNVLYELDGKPALALYKTYLGDKAADLPASGLLFPLALVGTGDADDRNVVRTLLDVDHDAQSLTFAGDLPEGSRVQLMKAHFDRLIDGADIAASMARAEVLESPALAVAVSCVGRRLVLGDRTEDELEAVAERLGPNAMVTGFYSYGELSPVVNGRCDLHNQTMTLTVFSETTSEGSDPITAVDFNKTMLVPTNTFTTARYLFSLDDDEWDQSPSPALDSPNTLVLAFGSPRIWEERDVMADLLARFPKAKIVGCSGSGEIAGGHVVDDSLSVAVAQFQKTQIRTALKSVPTPSDSFEAGASVARDLAAMDGLRAVFLLSEGLGVNGTDLVRGVNSVVGEDVLVTGGLAGDGTRFERTWIYADNDFHTKAVVAVGFYGDYLRISHGSQGGWDNFGPEREVTRSDGNVVYELDGRPALALYKTYLGDKADDLPASGLLFPLALLGDEGDERNVVRTLLSVDHEEQSLTFAGDLPEGSRVQLMKARFDKLVDAAEVAAKLAFVDDMSENALAVAVSCVGRRLVLGDRTEEELEAILGRFEDDVVLTGFYSYGELSPVADGACDLHNQTMTLTVFGESASPIAVKSRDLDTQITAPPVSMPAHKRERAGTPPPPAFKPQKVPSSKASQMLPAAAFDASSWVRETVPIRSHVPPRGAIDVETISTDGITIVKLDGKLDEKFKGAELGRALRGLVMFDLAEVHRVTSFGVREWLTMLRERKGIDAIYLTRCSEAVSNQLATINAFRGDATIVSFFAPYRCEHCSTAFNAMIDTEYDHESLAQNVPPEVTCPRCAMETRGLDEDPLTFFAFARKKPEVPNFVRARIAQLDPIGKVEPVEKQILDDATSIRINVELDDSIRWRRLLDGVEGKVIVDFMGGTTATDTGARRFVASARGHTSEANFEIYDAPWELLVAAHEADLDVTFKSAFVEVSTGHGVDRVNVDFEASARRIADGKSPDVLDADGGVNYDFSGVSDVLAYAAKIEVDDATEPESAPEEDSTRPAPEPTRSHADPVPAPSTGLTPMQSAVIAVLATVLVIVAGWKFYGDSIAPTSGSESAATATQTDQAMADPSAATDEKGGAQAEDDENESAAGDAEKAKIGVWDTDDGIRPAWADTAVLTRGDDLVVIGTGTATTRDAAILAAMPDATANVLAHVETKLRGTPVYEVAAAAPNNDRAEAVAIFQRQIGAKLALQRQDQAFRKTDEGVEAAVQYTVPNAVVEEIVAYYTRSFDTPSADFGVRFPTIPGPPEHDVMVIRSRTDLVRPADIVLSEAGESVFAFETLAEIARNEGRISLVVNSGGTARSARLLTRN